MIELKITTLFYVLADRPTGLGHARSYSGSVAELGPDAGRITWDNCLRDGDRLLAALNSGGRPTDRVLDGIREYAASFGAWDRAEIKTWTAAEAMAFLLQDIASAVRQWTAVTGSDHGWCGDWQMYEEAAEAGSVGGRLYLTSGDGPDDGDEVYYTLSD